MAKQFFLGAMAAFAIALPNIASADVIDDFDGTTGIGILAGPNWQSKWAGGSTQQNLITNTVSAGVGGSNGAVLDVAVAERQYNALNQTGVSVPVYVGNTLTLSSDFQFAHDGAALVNQNAPFMGLQISNTSDWFSGPNIDFTAIRRGGAGQVLGVDTPAPGVTGWNPTTDFGLPTGGAAGTSDWFKMEIVLTDNGTTYDAVYNLYGSAEGTPLTSVAEATTVASGTMLYGGYTTSWNNVGAVPINTVNGVTSAGFDNFSFTSVDLTPASIPEPASMAFIGLGMAGAGLVRRRQN